MQFEETGIEGIVINFYELEHIMNDAGFIRGGQWDWKRVTYDFKFENQSNGDVHYLRIPGEAIKGEIEQSHAQIKLKTPYLGAHYYPHGVEYEEEFPDYIINTCKERLNVLTELIESHVGTRTQ